MLNLEHAPALPYKGQYMHSEVKGALLHAGALQCRAHCNH